MSRYAVHPMEQKFYDYNAQRSDNPITKIISNPLIYKEGVQAMTTDQNTRQTMTFEKWYYSFRAEGTCHMQTIDMAKSAWQKSRQQAIQECAEIAENEKLLDDLDNDGDRGYNLACKHIIDAIRKLI